MSFDGVRRMCMPLASAVTNFSQKYGLQNTVFSVVGVVFGLFYDYKVSVAILGAYWYPKMDEKYELNEKISQLVQDVYARYFPEA